MDKRKQLAIIFSYNENWIGGTYYILNLIHALNLLPESQKPYISVISSFKKDFFFLQNQTQYPYLNFIKFKSSDTLWVKAINAIPLRLLKKKWISPKVKKGFDLLFPNPTGDFFSEIAEDKKVFWIPDFQEHHLPDFFSTNELISIKQRQVDYAYRAKKMIFSSKDSKKDFLELFPKNKANISIIPFSVTHPDFSAINFESLLTKFNILHPYFYVPNQFWLHKNHIIVIEAIKKLKTTQKNILILFSGKEHDHRNPDHINHLKQLVKDYSLEDNIKFLGFLDRKEQLCILNNAQAIIQPSLSEGWSTVIEDAKALNKTIISSNLNVHIEQLEEYQNHLFFNPTSSDELINAILEMETLKSSQPYNYDHFRLLHAEKFLTLFE